MQYERKSKLLFVVSILMVVFGGISVLTGLAALGGDSASAILAQAQREMDAAGFNFDLGTIQDTPLVAVMQWVPTIVSLVAGVLGILNCAKPENAQTCLIGAIVLFAATFCYSVVMIAHTTGFFQIIMIVSMPFGFILPILYFIGVRKLKKLTEQHSQYPQQPPYPPYPPQ